MAVAVAVRLLAPLLIFKWRIAGMVLAVLADALDVVLADFFAILLGEAAGFGERYQLFDKLLDTYCSALWLIVSLSWKNTLARNTSIILFAYRLTGFILFEVTGIRALFLFFPNLFAIFFFFYTIAERFFPRLAPKTLPSLLLALLLLSIPKFLQEWGLHYAQLHPWQWIKGLF